MKYPFQVHFSVIRQIVTKLVRERAWKTAYQVRRRESYTRGK